MKQLEDYEEAVMARRLAEMPPDEVDRLMAEVQRFLFAIQPASYAPRTGQKSGCPWVVHCRGVMGGRSIEMSLGSLGVSKCSFMSWCAASRSVLLSHHASHAAGQAPMPSDSNGKKNTETATLVSCFLC